MNVQHFVIMAEEDERAAREKKEEQRRSVIESNKRVFHELLTPGAYKALGIDLGQIVETEGTTEVYVRGEFEVDGETAWIQVNVSDHGPDAEVTLPLHINTMLFLDDHDRNALRIGHLIQEYVHKAKQLRKEARQRMISVTRSRIQNCTLDNKDEGLAQLRKIKEQVVALEDNPLTEDEKQALINHIGNRATEIHGMYNKRKVVAEQVLKAAGEYATEMGHYMHNLEHFVQDETDRLWSPWEARRITYPLVEGNLYLNLAVEDDNRYLEGVTLNDRLTRTIVVDKVADKDGWLIEYLPDGSTQRVQVKSIMETRPVEFTEPVIDRPLDYHWSFPVGDGFYVNVPGYWIEFKDEDLHEPPDPPEQRWGQRLDAIPHLIDLFPHDAVDHIYSDQGEHQHEYIKRLMSSYL